MAQSVLGDDDQNGCHFDVVTDLDLKLMKTRHLPKIDFFCKILSSYAHMIQNFNIAYLHFIFIVSFSTT